MYKKIVASIDGSEQSQRALSHAIELTKRFDSELTVITVASCKQSPIPMEEMHFVETSKGGPMSKREVYDLLLTCEESYHVDVLKKTKEICEKDGLKVRTELLRGTTVDEIIKFLHEDPHDLVVMGSRGLGGFKRLMLGSTSSAVIQHCHHSVLIVK